MTFDAKLAGQRLLDAYKTSYDRGETGALFGAASLCLEWGITPAPEWVTAALKIGLARISALEVKTIDEAFGNLYPRHTQLAALRKRRLHMDVWLAVDARRRRGEPIDNEMFEAVGADLGVGGRETARKLYEHAKRYWRRLETAKR